MSSEKLPLRADTHLSTSEFDSADLKDLKLCAPFDVHAKDLKAAGTVSRWKSHPDERGNPWDVQHALRRAVVLCRSALTWFCKAFLAGQLSWSSHMAKKKAAATVQRRSFGHRTVTWLELRSKRSYLKGSGGFTAACLLLPFAAVAQVPVYRRLVGRARNNQVDVLLRPNRPRLAFQWNAAYAAAVISCKQEVSSVAGFGRTEQGNTSSSKLEQDQLVVYEGS